MNTYRNVLLYLDSFLNYEKKTTFSYRVFSLRKVKTLFERLDIAYERLPVIHVAGTKGKGSTSTFCADLLAASGFKTGLYTSPHFFDLRERIKILTSGGSRLIDKKALLDIVNYIEPRLKKLKNKPTFFEIYTAIAVKYFLRQKVDFAVLETGMGGRLDATNIMTPRVCVISHIGYDHTDKLGKTLLNIAYEKAGIIKKGIPVVCASQKKSVMNVIKKKCKATKSPLYVYSGDFSAGRIRLNHRDTVFDFKFLDAAIKDLQISLRGKYQVENASLALAAVSLLRSKRRIDFKKGIRDTFIEGRFEIVRKDPLTVVDIAHNPSSFSVLRENIKTYFPFRKVILIFAASTLSVTTGFSLVNNKVFPFEFEFI